MVERVAPYSCSSCIHLQKEDPIISGEMALYRCTSQKRNGRCVGWVEVKRPDKGMRVQGGSCCNRLYPGDKLEIKSHFSDSRLRYLYCGKVGNKYLLHRTSTGGYMEVDKGYLRGQTGNISNRIKCVEQNPAQLEASKRMAKKRKAKWLKENE